jgi:hypothetical protein
MVVNKLPHAVWMYTLMDIDSYLGILLSYYRKFLTLCEMVSTAVV